MNIIKEAYENWCRPRMNNIEPDHPFDAFTAGWNAGIKSWLRDTDKVCEIIMKTFIGKDGNYEDIPLSQILERMTDDWIDDEITSANISELRDACKRLKERIKELEETIGEGIHLARIYGDIGMMDNWCRDAGNLLPKEKPE